MHGFCASSDDAAVVAVAESLHRDGFDVVSYDARGHGRSSGESTLGDLEQHDVAAAVELARERSNDVVLVGASMGAIAVTALRLDRPDAAWGRVGELSRTLVAAVNPTAAAAAVMTRTPFGRAFLARMAKVRVAARWTSPEPPVELVSRLEVPLTVIHGTSDRFIPVKASYELYANATSERMLELVPRMGHAYDELATEAIRRAVTWSLSNRLVEPAP